MLDSDIERMDRLSYKQKIKEEAKKIGRPTLLKRVTSGVIDLFLLALVFLATILFISGVLFEPLGYYDNFNLVNEIQENSGLFIYDNGTYYTVNDKYDTTKTPEENYDIRVTNFYSNDELAIKENKLNIYNNAKIDSGLFEYNNNVLVRKTSASDKDVEAFLNIRYNDAVSFLKSNPDYVVAYNKMFYMLAYSTLISFIFSSTIFYLIIPLLKKEGETIGQMICKICLINSSNNSKVSKTQVFLRYLAVISINFLIPFFIYIEFGKFTLIFNFVSIAIMCFTKYNKGIQDYVSSTHVILKNRVDAMDTLKMINENNKNY